MNKGLLKTAGRWRRWIAQHPRITLAGFALAMLLIAGWRLTQPGALWGPQDGTWYRVQINHDLYVGIDPSYPPFAEWTPDGIIGFEADIAREIGRRLGAETQILIMGYDGLYDSLYTGHVDMLIAGLKVDKGLTHWVYYTRPYFDVGQVLVSRNDAPFDTMCQLDGKTVAVEIASAGDLSAHRWLRRLHALEVVRYWLPEAAMQAVQQGNADAALIDTVSARQYVSQHRDLKMASQTVVPEEYVIALRKGNFRLTEEVSQALSDMIADGTLDSMIARWL